MRVALVGNDGNNNYRLCKWMREAGTDAHLYLLRQETGPRSLPEQVDVALASDRQGYPSWIHLYDDRLGRPSLILPSRTARRIERDFDAVVTSGPAALIAVNQFRAAPIVHLTSGSEVNVYPLLLFKPRVGPLMRAASFMMRRALRRVHKATAAFRPVVDALTALGLQDKIAVWPFPEDVEGNVHRVDADLKRRLDAQYAGYDRVFLWLSRLEFREPDSPHYKGPERFLAALKRVIVQDGANVRAVIGNHGTDAEPFLRRIEDEGLADHVDLVPHLPYWKLLTYLSMDRAAAFDELAAKRDELSGMSREALSVGCVLVRNIDREHVAACYGGDCPVLSARDTEMCYDAMTCLLAMGDEELAALQHRHRAWARQYLHYTHLVPTFMELLREAVEASQRGPG